MHLLSCIPTSIVMWTLSHGYVQSPWPSARQAGLKKNQSLEGSKCISTTYFGAKRTPLTTKTIILEGSDCKSILNHITNNLQKVWFGSDRYTQGILRALTEHTRRLKPEETGARRSCCRGGIPAWIATNQGDRKRPQER